MGDGAPGREASLNGRCLGVSPETGAGSRDVKQVRSQCEAGRGPGNWVARGLPGTAQATVETGNQTWQVQAGNLAMQQKRSPASQKRSLPQRGAATPGPSL
ncbi:hypothetical protein H8959_006688 [Pygathrix nigripes]